MCTTGHRSADPQIRTLRSELGLEDVCLLVPQTTRTQPWLQAMDIFVLPSTSEASSNALLEAMSSQCMAVASRIGGNIEIIDSGVNGLLFPAGDVQALTDALRSLIADPARRLEIGRAHV